MKFISLLLITFTLNFSCQRNEIPNLKQQRQEELTKEDLIPTSYLVNNSKSCFTSFVGDVACSYTIGNDLKFTIWGIGAKDSTIVVDNTSGEDGEYQIRFTPADPCIRVKLGRKNLDKYSISNPFYGLTFVSPMTGKAYDQLTECVYSFK